MWYNLSKYDQVHGTPLNFTWNPSMPMSNGKIIDPIHRPSTVTVVVQFGAFLVQVVTNSAKYSSSLEPLQCRKKGHHSPGMWVGLYHLVMTNIAMENPQNKWRFLAGKIIYFYGPSIPWRTGSHNQRVTFYKPIQL
jgi:hypothetical protein